MSSLTPLFVNNWSTTLASSVASGATTSFSLTSATGLPTIGTNQFIPAVVVDTSTSPETVKEYVYITAVSGTTATVTRAAEDSSTYAAAALASGLTVAAVTTKATLPATTPIIAPHPSMHSLLGWTFDPAVTAGGGSGLQGVAGGSGFMFLYAVHVAAPCLVTNLIAEVSTGGSGLTVALMGLYDRSGTRLAVTSDQSTAWASTGVITMPLTAAVTVSPGLLYVARFVSGTTPPSLRGINNALATVNNAAMPANTVRAGSLGSQTTLPTSVTMSSFGTAASVTWVGLS